MIAESIYIQLTEKKGWGVFTDKPLEEGIIIEIAPVIVMSAAERVLLDKTRLFNYIFEWEHDQCCMALGYVPLYNHASPSNCEYFQLYKEGTIFVKTVARINAGEELTINYNGDSKNDAGVWFDLHD
jgi:SET domain-containing protein